ILPPVVTKTWYHTGAWQKRRALFDAFEQEWFQPGSEPRLSMPAFEASWALSPPELHQAHRALAGRMLRQEAYAEDGSAEAALPYVVTQQTHGVRAIQPTRDAPYAVFLPLGAETLTIHYERLDPNDINAPPPRISHQLTIEVDAFGVVTKSAAI